MSSQAANVNADNPESGKPGASPRVSRTQVRRALKEHCVEFLEDKMDAMLGDLDQSLFSQAENSPSNADQVQFLEAMTLLRGERGRIQHRTLAEFDKSFTRYFGAATTLPEDKPITTTDMSVEIDQLELVEISVLEDDLAISILASRVESSCAQVLWALNQRFAVICDDENKQEKDNPLGPVALSKVFQLAISSYDITEKAKISVYAQFNKSVLRYMGEFLAATNDLLASKGILPHLKYSLAKTKGGIKGGSAANQPDFDPDQQGMEGEGGAGVMPQWQQSMQAEQGLLDAMIQLQLKSLAINNNGMTHMGVPFGQVFSANPAAGERFTAADYVSVINNLQQAHKLQLEGGILAAPSSVVDVQRDFVGSLAQYAESANDEKKVPAADASTIDLVGTIFNEILEDSGLCSRVKALLSHLHTPFLKIALIDRSFMKEADHPARMLLNELAEAGGSWVTEKEDKFKAYDKLYQVVHRIIDDFDQDIEFIDRLREDFGNFTERLHKRFELAEKRCTQAEEGLDKIEVGKKKSLELFHRRAVAKRMPIAARDILEQTCVDFLVFVYLRFGSESETWKKAVLMLNQTFVRVHASLLTGDSELMSADVEARLTAESGENSAQSAIAKIDAQVRGDLLELGYDEDHIREMFELINKASSVRPEDEWRAKYVNRGEAPQRKVTRGLDIGARQQEEAASLEADIKLDFEITQLEDDLDEKEQELREKLRGIAYGTWFEWLQDDGTIEKTLKLAWYSSMSDNYMFVNQSGVKVMVETLNNLTRKVHRGSIRVININNDSFMERLFKRIVNTMQSSA